MSYDKAELIQVIRTDLTRRGDGRFSPIRAITQYWSIDGQLLAEVDPMEDAHIIDEEHETPQ